MAASLTGWLSQLNDQLLLLINSVAGRSWLFDSVVAFFLGNDLAKAGVIGGCFLAAWYGGKTLDSTNERRRILITTLIAACCVITTTKVMSKTIFLPRPEIQTQKIYKLDGDQLVEMKRMPVRTMLDEESQKDHRALLSGDVDSNDLGSFPSDHAGFFMAIALGIFLASRRWGLLALGWSVFVIMAAKMISGQHTPLDVAAGVSVALVEVTIVQYVVRKNFRGWLDKLTGMTLRYTALSSAVVFLIAFEVSSTMIHVREFLQLLAAMRRHVMLGMG
ncbi:MAG TPA: phosphatase PAP2 family protein [Pyrinomonadaceae bacterium]|jgi:membrane-associated phospholipid phosphatase|nr:phosphatase PAP2 family protein [Pyrinomonadaceae bacterium]